MNDTSILHVLSLRTNSITMYWYNFESILPSLPTRQNINRFPAHHLVSSFWNTGLCLPYPIMGCFKSNFILVGKRRRRRVIATCELKSADLHITSKGIQALNTSIFINQNISIIIYLIKNGILARFYRIVFLVR